MLVPLGYIVRKGNVLESVCSYNTGGNEAYIPLEARPSIIARVAREGKGYVTGRATTDPFYRKGLKMTRSEMAAPLPAWSKTPGVGTPGVVNLESPLEGAFTEGDLEDLTSAVGELVPDLMVLQALDRPPHEGKWCPWHPEVSGPDLASVLSRLCEAVKRDVDHESDDAQCALWWVDAENRRLAIYSTSGYGQDYSKYGMSIPFESALGQAVVLPLGEYYKTGPDDLHWLRTYKGEAMGVNRAVVIPLYRMNRRSKQASALLTIYAFSEAASERLPDELAVRALARMFSAVIAGYDHIRHKVGKAITRQSLQGHPYIDNIPNSAFENDAILRRQLEEIAIAPSLDGVPDAFATLEVEARRLLQLDGFSVFVRIPGTGRFRAATDTVRTSSRVAEYDTTVDIGYTSFHASHPGVMAIRNAPNDPATPGFPAAPLNKHPERLPGPVLRYSRYMGFGLPGLDDTGQTEAVFKCVRSVRQRPFTDGDARVLRAIATVATDLVTAWQQTLDRPDPAQSQAVRSRVRAFSRWRRRLCSSAEADSPRQDIPAPLLFRVLSRMYAPARPNREFFGNMLENLWLLAGPLDPVRAGVIIRRQFDPGGSVLAPYQVLAWQERDRDEPLSEENASEKLAHGDVPLSGVRWADLFNTRMVQRRAVTFRSDRLGDVRGGIRMPFSGWQGLHFVEGVLAIDIARDLAWTSEDVATAAIVASKLGQAFGNFPELSPKHPLIDPSLLLCHLKETISHQWMELKLDGRPTPQVSSWFASGRPISPSVWKEIGDPDVSKSSESPQDRSARRLGVRSAMIDGQVVLEVPLVYGCARPAVYRLATRLDDEDIDGSLRNTLIGTIYSGWTQFCHDVPDLAGALDFSESAPGSHESPTSGAGVTTWDGIVDWSRVFSPLETE